VPHSANTVAAFVLWARRGRTGFVITKRHTRGSQTSGGESHPSTTSALRRRTPNGRTHAMIGSTWSVVAICILADLSIGLSARDNRRTHRERIMTEEARWEVPGRDLLGRQRSSSVTVNERGDIVVLPPPPCGFVVNPETEFDQLISALNKARTAAREVRQQTRSR
jgi:hypothetical protein